MATRITKNQYFSDIRAILSGEVAPNSISVDELVSFIDREIELLAKKNASGTRKPTAVQAANEGYKGLILDFLATQSGGVSCTDIQKGVPELMDFNNQKVAALVNQLVKAGTVSKAIVKGKSLFTLA